MEQLNEDLLAGDLKHLVSHVFEVDSFKSKIGDDEDIVVISFTVDEKAPADDLARFLEMGYNFVLDADATQGPVKNGKFKVFVEMKRDRYVPRQLEEILHGIKRVAEIEEFKFRYYKSFKSLPADISAFEEIIPLTGKDYKERIATNSLNNFSNFFSKSNADEVDVLENNIKFERIYGDPINMTIKDFGLKKDVYESTPGPLKLEPQDMSEILFLTKYIGNYNITKINDTFIFENDRFAVALEKK
jgi:hypothetical protein